MHKSNADFDSGRDLAMALEQARREVEELKKEVVLLTAAKETQPSEDLNRLNKKLQDDVKRLQGLALQLAEARDNALRASILKSTFIANVSHELRTPLSGVIASVELILAKPAFLDQEQLDLMNVALTEARSLLDIVNDLLDLARIETGKFAIEWSQFSPNALVQEIVGMFTDRANAKDLRLRVDIDPRVPNEVSGDRRRIRQVLLNLVGNAIKFTNSGEVCISLSECSRIDENTIGITFAVSDTGIGISENERELLFQPFSQLDSSNTQQHGGVGLGLALSQNLIELMGGTIVLESKKGVGSVFWFSLPFQTGSLATSSEEDAQSVGPVDAFRDKLVLVVEDNLVIQTLTVKQLLLLGLHAQAVSTGKAVLNVRQSSHFDLILMDCHLPDVSGFEIAKQIRRLEAEGTEHTPIIALTAGAMTGDRDDCLSAGMDDYLSKPVSISQLRRKLQQWLAPATLQHKIANQC